MTALDYIKNLKSGRKKAMTILRRAIFELYPDIEEAMDYKMPTYLYKGQTLCAMASQKNYMALYIMPYDLLDNFAKELEDFDCGKSCIRFKSLDEEKIDILIQILEFVGPNYSESKFFGKMNPIR